MSRERSLRALAALFLILALALPAGQGLWLWHWPPAGGALTLAALGCARPGLAAAVASLAFTAAGLALFVATGTDFGSGVAAVPGCLALAILAWRVMARLSQRDGSRLIRLAVPALFCAVVLFFWEALVRGYQVPRVLLPTPSAVVLALVGHAGELAADFRQTVLKGVLSGFVLGSGAGFLVALAVDRSPFLERGLLPLGGLASAVPIVGIAPIMVMWFGFDWPSKAAVVVVMTFFPMLNATLSGLKETDRMQLDLMRSYGAGYLRTLWHLRLPAALPMIFTALKLNSTLSLIGAIVAEFFGTPIVGMGFRISTEVARMNVDIVWATILVAALTGSLFYGMLALIERAVTFWHPSYR